MLFSTLGRYFLKRYLLTTLYFFLGVISIIFLVDYSETNRRFSDLAEFTVSSALLMTAVRLPLILQQTIPFIALFTGMTVLITLNRKSELVVARAAGISVWQFMFPFLFGAAALGILAILVINPLAAWGQGFSARIQAGWHEEANRTTDVVPWLRQISGSNDIIIGGKTALDGGTRLTDAVFIYFDSDDRIILRQDAAEAKLEDGYWNLTDVSEVRPGEIARRLPSVKVPTNLKREFVSERLVAPETVAFYELSRKIEIARSFGVSTKPLETQYHSLLSMPFVLVAMTLIAATVSLRFSRINQSRSVILGGIVSGFVLYVVTVLVKAFGSSGVVPPFIAAWIPVFVALAFGSTILLHQEDG